MELNRYELNKYKFLGGEIIKIILFFSFYINLIRPISSISLNILQKLLKWNVKGQDFLFVSLCVNLI
jgi:hypothetical protein